MRHNGHVLRSLRTIFDAGTVAGLTDGQLLERFATRSGSPAELAFAALVERHGPMVLRVCRNHLGDHDAQDAFQATFLVLVRQARTLWVRDSLGPWLHRVAQRSARRARREARRRKAIEQAAAEQRAAREQPTCPDGDELGPLLHEEIDRLPERLRVPLVLCELEGRTQEEAARHLGCPVGTVKSRLARGRARLRQRLLRRGLAPALAGPLVSIEAARAAVPAGLKELMITRLVADLAGKAVPGAFPASVTALTEGVLRTMFLIKLKTIAAGLGLAVAATGAGVLANQLPPGADHHEGSGQPAAAPAASADTITVLGTPVRATSLVAQRDDDGPRPDRSDSERIAELERKLDQLMKALEEQKRATARLQPSSMSGMYGYGGQSHAPAPALAAGQPTARAASPAGRAVATTLPAPADVATVDSGPNLRDVMKRLEQLDRKIDRLLERGVPAQASGNPLGQPTQPSQPVQPSANVPF